MNSEEAHLLVRLRQRRAAKGLSIVLLVVMDCFFSSLAPDLRLDSSKVFLAPTPSKRQIPAVFVLQTDADVNGQFTSDITRTSPAVR